MNHFIYLTNLPVIFTPSILPTIALAIAFSLTQSGQGSTLQSVLTICVKGFTQRILQCTGSVLPRKGYSRIQDMRKLAGRGEGSIMDD